MGLINNRLFRVQTQGPKEVLVKVAAIGIYHDSNSHYIHQDLLRIWGWNRDCLPAIVLWNQNRVSYWEMVPVPILGCKGNLSEGDCHWNQSCRFQWLPTSPGPPKDLGFEQGLYQQKSSAINMGSVIGIILSRFQRWFVRRPW